MLLLFQFLILHCSCIEMQLCPEIAKPSESFSSCFPFFFFFCIVLKNFLCVRPYGLQIKTILPFFPPIYIFFLPLHLNALTRTSNRILIRGSQNEDPYFSPSLRKKPFNFSQLIMMLSIVSH